MKFNFLEKKVENTAIKSPETGISKSESIDSKIEETKKENIEKYEDIQKEIENGALENKGPSVLGKVLGRIIELKNAIAGFATGAAGIAAIVAIEKSTHLDPSSNSVTVALLAAGTLLSLAYGTTAAESA